MCRWFNWFCVHECVHVCSFACMMRKGVMCHWDCCLMADGMAPLSSGSSLNNQSMLVDSVLTRMYTQPDQIKKTGLKEEVVKLLKKMQNITSVCRHPCQDQLLFIHWYHFTLLDPREPASAALTDGSQGGDTTAREHSKKQTECFSSVSFKSSLSSFYNLFPPSLFSVSFLCLHGLVFLALNLSLWPKHVSRRKRKDQSTALSSSAVYSTEAMSWKIHTELV